MKRVSKKPPKKRASNKLTCAVIGAGVSGLASACLLAKKGYHVTVYEQHTTFGGKVRVEKVGESLFDTGPSLCTDEAIIDSIYTMCGKNPREYWHYTPLPELTRYFWKDGFSYIMTPGMPYIERALVRLFNEKPTKVHRYMKRLYSAYKKSAHYFIDNSIRRSQLFRPKVLKGLIFASPLVVSRLHWRNARYFSNKKLVQLFDRFATYSGSNPYRASALVGFSAVPELSHGAVFPKGGMRGIVNGLYALALDLGVEFKLSLHVTGLTYDGTCITHVESHNHREPYDVIIYSGDKATFYDLVRDAKEKRKQIASDSSSSAIIFYWQVRGTFKRFGLHNVLFSDDYKLEQEEIFGRRQVPTDPTIYISITCKEDASHAPKGYENWFVMINVPSQLPESDIFIARERIIEKLERFLGGYLTITHEEYLSPRNLDAVMGAFGGAIYGQSSNSIKVLTTKQAINSEKYPNVFFVGGSVHPGGGIPLAIRSAKIMARQL